MENLNKPSRETLAHWHQDQKNWKWGLFYYNKEDKRIFPPKRNKLLGWTVNFANPLSIWVFIVLLVLVIMIAEFLKRP